jgi:hypothetical protein
VASSDAETASTTTALLAIVAAGLGDPLAADMDAYVEANPPRDTLVALERALAARFWADRIPGADAVASLTVDGVTRRVAIRPDQPTWLTLTPAQLANARLSPIEGTPIVTSRWEGPLDPGDLDGQAITRFTRRVTPRGAVAPDQVIVVTFAVELAARADDGCWRVTDLVPSGLAPIANAPTWWRDEEEGAPASVTPWRVVGQRVDFCVWRDDKRPVQSLRYIARVVTPGTFHWEPAVIQSTVIPEWGAVIPGSELTITAE